MERDKKKLQVGKTYETRDGRDVTILREHDSENFLGTNGTIYRSSGQFTDRKEFDCDLIKEVKEE